MFLGEWERSGSENRERGEMKERMWLTFVSSLGLSQIVELFLCMYLVMGDWRDRDGEV